MHLSWIKFFLSVLSLMLLVVMGSQSNTFAAPLEAPPTTGFEDRGGNGWTTLAEETAFLEEVATLSDRVSYSEIGTTVEGRTMNLVRIGFPEPPSNEEIAEGRNMLVIGSQHGNEPAGREMSLQLLRDLAFTEDQELIDLLEESTVLIIPTANPDGRVRNWRYNAERVDLNRDFLHLSTPETKAISEIMGYYGPDIIIDAHERPSGGSPVMEMTASRNPNIDEALFDFSKNMVEDYLMGYVEEAGFTSGIYGSPGNWLPENILGFRHSIDILTESAGSLHPNIRVDAQMAAVEGVLQFYREQFEEIGTLVTDAAERKASAAARGEAYHLDSSTIQEPMACGYLLHASQTEKISRYIELLPLETEKVSENGVFVSMEQPMMTKIPLLLDVDSAYNKVNGLRLNDCADPGDIEPPDPIEQTEPAQYQTDFSKDILGEEPIGWTPIWKESSWTVLDNPRRLEHYVEGEGNGRRALTMDEAGEVHGDVEISGVVRASDSGDTMLQIGFHMSGERTDEVSSENYYYLDIRKPDANGSPNMVRINKVEDGSYSLLGSAQMPFYAAENSWYQVVLQREGDMLRAKIWPFGEKEPVAFQVQVTDRTFDHGHVGLAHFDSFTVNEWGFVGVGTGGEPAPRAPEDLFDPEVDKAALQERFDEINDKNLKEDDYTEESWQGLLEALEQAGDVLNDPDAVQSDVDSALARLNEAFDGLKEVEPISASRMITSVEHFAEEGAFENEIVTRSLITHLTTVAHYEEKGQAGKVIKHMESFLQLIFHQKETGLMTEDAYNSLYSNANALIEKWR